MQQLHPKSVWLFFANFFVGMIILSVPLGWFAFIFNEATKNTPSFEVQRELPWVFLFIINFWWIPIILIGLFGYIWARLSYSNYKYELREDGFRKEHGVIWKKYVTIPYERIQNVDIYRGLLARILGLSDLNIQTAGMSVTRGSYGGGSEGRLPGLSPEVAEQLRDELVKRARGKHQSI